MIYKYFDDARVHNTHTHTKRDEVEPTTWDELRSCVNDIEMSAIEANERDEKNVVVDDASQRDVDGKKRQLAFSDDDIDARDDIAVVDAVDRGADIVDDDDDDATITTTTTTTTTKTRRLSQFADVGFARHDSSRQSSTRVRRDDILALVFVFCFFCLFLFLFVFVFVLVCFVLV